MRIVFAINHPAHYHLFKNTYQILKKRGHVVNFVIKDKDILGKLLLSEGVDYILLRRKHVVRNKFAILAKGILDLFIQDFNLLKFVLKYKPTLMVGTDISITHIGKLINIPSIVFNEDDFGINKYFCQLAYPLSTCIVSPSLCDVGKYISKKVSYNGYQKLSYLHPQVFQPDEKIVEQYLDPHEKYFIIRLVGFSAGHDIEMNHSGLKRGTIYELIETLSPFGNVFITSEAELPTDLEKFKLNINIRDIHHLLAFASIFIGDSQSMIVEAAILGTPSIRFNSFVGKISVLSELETYYGLTIGIHSSRPDLLMRQVKEMLETKNLKRAIAKRRDKMLNDKIAVNSFFTWFIENYPQSEIIMKKNPDFQLNFKYNN
jgi:uncharacterized protein